MRKVELQKDIELELMHAVAAENYELQKSLKWLAQSLDRGIVTPMQASILLAQRDQYFKEREEKNPFAKQKKIVNEHWRLRGIPF